MEFLDGVTKYVEEKYERYVSMNDKIWNFAELKYKEFKSCMLQQKVFSEEGFSIMPNLCNIETAFWAEYGSGKPIIAILGEYDALPNLSEDGVSTAHACGHNTLGAAAAFAAAVVKSVMKENNMKGTIRYYGCPAEESGGGKTFLARDGAFADIDVALSWHPSDKNAIITSGSLANVRIVYDFEGLSAHAAMDPHLGRSALDAVELMNVGVNFLREHLIPEAKIHYAITNSGGDAPNVVQKEAQVLYAIRAPKRKSLESIIPRVDKIAEGASLMTETSVKKRLVSGYSEYMANDVLSALVCKNLKSAICEELEPPCPMIGSTDLGDVSQIVPTAQFFVACYPKGTPGHSWELASYGCSPSAHKGMKIAATVLANTAVDIFKESDIVEKARSSFEKETEANPYVCPVPKDLIAGSW